MRYSLTGLPKSLGHWSSQDYLLHSSTSKLGKNQRKKKKKNNDIQRRMRSCVRIIKKKKKGSNVYNHESRCERLAAWGLNTTDTFGKFINCFLVISEESPALTSNDCVFIFLFFIEKIIIHLNISFCK